MRKSVIIAGLVVMALALGSPAFAVCVAPRTFASVGATANTAYVYRADQVTAWGGTYADGVLSGPGPSVSDGLTGAFWALGAGNPSATPGLGVDSGSQPAHGYWLFYGGTDGGGNFYPHYITGSWSGDARIDGCIDTTGSNPAGPDAQQCNYVLLNDEDGAGNGYFAVATASADGIGNYDLSSAGQIVLQPIPKPRITGSTRVSAGQVDLQVALSSVPAGPGGGVYLGGCGAGAVNFRLYRQNVPRNAPAPSDRDLSQGWQPLGSPTAAGGTAAVSVTCSGDEDIYLTASLVFDSGYELSLGSGNGTAVQCGPTLVDPVKPIMPPRRKPAGNDGPRDDRGSRR